MFMLLGGNDKKTKKEISQAQSIKEAKELFNMGRFPVVTTQQIENRPIAKVLGLVCCRGFDSEEAFFGMAAMAVKKGAQGIIGYNENVAFHPDGSKFFSCFGTAVMFEREGRNDLLNDPVRIKSALSRIPTASAPRMNVIDEIGGDESEEYAAKEDTVSFSSFARSARQIFDKGEDRSVRQENRIKAEAKVQSGEPSGMQSGVQNNAGTAEKKQVLNSAQIAAQMLQEEEAEMRMNSRLSQPSEEEDPVLQRILANQKRQAVSDLQ